MTDWFFLLGTRKNGRARRRHARGEVASRVSLARARSLFTSKRLLRRLFLLLINCYDFQKVQETIIIDNTFVFIEYLRVTVMDTYFQTIQRCTYPIQPLKQ